MSALKAFANLLALIKLLPGVLLFLFGAFMLWGNLSVGAYRNSLIAGLMAASAIALGYPFSWIRTKGLLAWAIIPFSAVPLGWMIEDKEPFGLLTFIAALWMVLAITDLVLSRRLAPVGWSGRKCAGVLACGVLLGIVGIAGGYVSSQGRSYRPPAIAFQGDSKDLKQSIIVPTLDTPLPKGANVVWCGTIQLGWNRLAKDILNETPRLTGAETVVSRLNQGQLGEADVQPDSYLATAGFGRAGIVENVKAEMKRRFQRDVAVDTIAPDDVLVYAYLQASVAFKIPFFETTQALRFHASNDTETEVGSFGIEEKHEYAYYALRDQIDVLYLYRSEANLDRPEEFIIDPCNGSSPYQIVLACVPPRATLSETLKDVEEKTRDYSREGHKRRGFSVRDVLLVPNLNWEVTHRFRELEGSDKRFLNAAFRGKYIAKAMQTICFKLDRSGAELASEYQEYCKPMATYFVFDRPFLIYIKRRGGERPFFVMWVDNAELLSRR